MIIIQVMLINLVRRRCLWANSPGIKFCTGKRFYLACDTSGSLATLQLGDDTTWWLPHATMAQARQLHGKGGGNKLTVS